MVVLGCYEQVFPEFYDIVGGYRWQSYRDVSKVNGKDRGGLLAQIEQLKAENQRLKKAQTARISFKVSEKGALSVYGMGRFPVTLYRSQRERLFQVIPNPGVHPGQF